MEDITPITPDENFDAFAYYAAVDMIHTLRPRVFSLSLGEPDEWAHARRYDRYLQSIQRCDRFIRQLLENLQADPEYRGTTSFVLCSDHGRGATPEHWTGHSKEIPQSDETWIAAFGAAVPARGERRDAAEVEPSASRRHGRGARGRRFPRGVPGGGGADRGGLGSAGVEVSRRDCSHSRPHGPSRR